LLSAIENKPVQPPIKKKGKVNWLIPSVAIVCIIAALYFFNVKTGFVSNLLKIETVDTLPKVDSTQIQDSLDEPNQTEPRDTTQTDITDSTSEIKPLPIEPDKQNDTIKKLPPQISETEKEVIKTLQQYNRLKRHDDSLLLAKLKLENADIIAPEDERIKKKMREVDSLILVAYDKYISEAKSKFDAKEFKKAKELFQKAKPFAKNPAVTDSKIEHCDEMIILHTPMEINWKNNTATDPRDKTMYGIVKIGEQVWLKENMQFETDTSGCYDGGPSFRKKYGRLYSWEAANKACPKGWRLPTTEDFETLLKQYKAATESLVVDKLKNADECLFEMLYFLQFIDK